MAMNKIDLGPIGVTAAGNVRRLRETRRLSYAELSRQLGGLGRPIPPLGLRQLEAGKRRVDLDDLVALALALGVSPLALMLPTDDSQLVANGDVLPVDRIWEWGHGRYPLGGDVLAFVRDSNPIAGVPVPAAPATFGLNVPVRLSMQGTLRQPDTEREENASGDS